MTSLRCKRGLGKLSVVLSLALLAGLPSPRLHAQDTAAVARDTAAVRRDSAGGTVPGAPAAPAPTGSPTAAQGGQPGMRPDSLRPDSLAPGAARADTAARDTMAGAARDTVAVAPPPPPPVDSALALACRESAGDPPDLLTVTFSSASTAADRDAVARAVGGTLLGQSEHQAPGSWYLHVPMSGLDPSVADRVIRMAPVLEVGSTRCPS